jgi:metal-dependent amidase/aminoacylase/carboxypeptidase family protein
MHQSPFYNEGEIFCPDGPVKSHITSFNAKIIGKGGHGAYPHLNSDPILTTAKVITQLSTILSRDTPAFATVVCSVCIVKSGSAMNVIPDFAEFAGTIRDYDSKMASLVVDRF